MNHTIIFNLFVSLFSKFSPKIGYKVCKLLGFHGGHLGVVMRKLGEDISKSLPVEQFFPNIFLFLFFQKFLINLPKLLPAFLFIGAMRNIFQEREGLNFMCEN